MPDTATTVIGLVSILGIVALVAALPERRPKPGPSWFDILPGLRQSKKQRTRLQQARRQGARRYGR